MRVKGYNPPFLCELTHHPGHPMTRGHALLDGGYALMRASHRWPGCNRSMVSATHVTSAKSRTTFGSRRNTHRLFWSGVAGVATAAGGAALMALPPGEEGP